MDLMVGYSMVMVLAFQLDTTSILLLVPEARQATCTYFATMAMFTSHRAVLMVGYSMVMEVIVSRAVLAMFL